ncbi:hypothetical protein B0H14DRAFT_2809218, partial [Mycena olivaceomarginata]
MLYGEIKLGNILISNYFAKTHSDVLISCSLHPGSINIELTRHAANWLQAIANPCFYPAPCRARQLQLPCKSLGRYVI